MDESKEVAAMGTKVEFSELTCPHDGEGLLLEYILLDDFPYIHIDASLACLKCKEKFMFGIPMYTKAGLALHIYDSNRWRAMFTAKRVKEMFKPLCPWHKREMVYTKFFGDWMDQVKDGVKYDVVQFKCPNCFYCKHFHVEHKEDNKHIWNDVPIQEIQEAVQEDMKEVTARLKSMGYLD